MKLKVGDNVLITAGKDKGKQGQVTQVDADKNQVVVAGVNLYTRNIKPMFGQPGQQLRRERPLPTAKVAIVNDKGQPDRVGYQLDSKGNKVRVFKKTGQVINGQQAKKAAKTSKNDNKEGEK